MEGDILLGTFLDGTAGRSWSAEAAIQVATVDLGGVSPGPQLVAVFDLVPLNDSFFVGLFPLFLLGGFLLLIFDLFDLE